MNTFKKLTIVACLALVGMLSMTPAYVSAAEDKDKKKDSSVVDSIQGGVNDVGGENQTKLGPRIKTVVSILMYVLGSIAVIMIIVGGIRYTTSNGDAGGIKSARDTILYAVVGLIVAILSYAIVNFVLDQF